jgi:hypothetical protein
MCTDMMQYSAGVIELMSNDAVTVIDGEAAKLYIFESDSSLWGLSQEHGVFMEHMLAE